MFVFIAFFFAAARLHGQAPTNALPTLAPPYGEIPPTFWEQQGTTVFVGGITLMALAVLILWKLFQPRPAVILPPEIVAREALTKLLRQPEDGRLLSEVSQILRRYVIAAFELPSGEFTTAEFSAALATGKNISPELSQAIPDFLRECDTQKFAPVVQSSAFSRPGPPEGETPNRLPPMNAAARALALVDLAERRREQMPAAT